MSSHDDTHDISKTAVMILLVLTIIMSLLGTWTVFEAATSPGMPAQSAGERGTQAQDGSAGDSGVPEEKAKATDTAAISLTILPQREEEE